jgi:hypothetical protein
MATALAGWLARTSSSQVFMRMRFGIEESFLKFGWRLQPNAPSKCNPKR